MTSNIGSDIIQEFAGDSQYQQMKAQVMNVLGQHFKPEFINRVDESVVFHPLIADQIKKIAKIQIEALADRLIEQELNLAINDEALSLISAAGFDPVFGARPLKRAIQQGVENPLAQKILGNEFTKGCTIEVSVAEGQLVFSSK
jgi:ATPases with chaperone activity, ATP-binding subunit